MIASHVRRTAKRAFLHFRDSRARRQCGMLWTIVPTVLVIGYSLGRRGSELAVGRNVLLPVTLVASGALLGRELVGAPVGAIGGATAALLASLVMWWTLRNDRPPS